jgi:hypothetical protein
MSIDTRRGATSALAVVLAALTPSGAVSARQVVAQQPPTLTTLLQQAGEYVLRLDHDLSGVVAEESYSQESTTKPKFGPSIRAHRDLRSDVLLVLADAGDRYVSFRDVFEVDGKAVRDRDDRLARLFIGKAPSSSEQLQRIRIESARYNLGDIFRDFNDPVFALRVLHPEFQSRFTFSVVKTGAAREPWEVEFHEVEPETIVRRVGGDDLPVRGRFRIEPGSGQVLLSELLTEDNILRADVTVTYQVDRVLGMLVPIEMRESVGTQSGRLAIEGQATYSHFRRFKVTVSESIGPTKQ